MNLIAFFPDLENIEKTEQIWREFHKLNVAIINNAWSSDELRMQTKSWLDVCTHVYGNAFVTPNMHLLQAHMHQYQEQDGKVNRFNCQQLEKKNQSNACNMFRSSNRHINMTEKDDFLVQLLCKNSRLEHLNKFDATIKKTSEKRKNQRKHNFIDNFCHHPLFK